MEARRSLVSIFLSRHIVNFALSERQSLRETSTLTLIDRSGLLTFAFCGLCLRLSR